MCTTVLDIGEISISKAIRLGKKESGDNVPPRPLKLVLENKSDKESIFKNLRKLKDAEEKYRQVSVSHDLPKELWESVKDRLAEAKRKDGENSKNYIYRVRGPPWNIEITRRKKQE